MKRLILALSLLCGLPLWAADSTIGNLAPITTVPDTYRMPWENPGVVDNYITFLNLTNQILSGYATTNQVHSQTNISYTAVTNAPWGLPQTNISYTAVTNAPWLTGNQTIAVSGDATGSGATAITLTVTNIQPPAAGSPGDVLTKTGSGVNWAAPSGGTANALTNLDTRSWTNNTGIYGNGVGLTNLQFTTPGLTNFVDANNTQVLSNETTGSFSLLTTNLVNVVSNANGQATYDGGNITASNFVGSFSGNGVGLTNLSVSGVQTNYTNIWTGTNTFTLPVIVTNTSLLVTGASTYFAVSNGATKVLLSGGAITTSGSGTFGGAVVLGNANSLQFATLGSLLMYNQSGYLPKVLQVIGNAAGTVAATGVVFSAGVPSGTNAFMSAQSGFPPVITFMSASANSNEDVRISGNLAITNGIYQMSIATNGAITCTTNKQFYLLSGTNQLVTLPDASNVPNIIFRFSSTNGYGSFIVTNATGAQYVRASGNLAYTNIGIAEVGFISDGAAWWLTSRGHVVMPSASWSHNTTITPVQDTITNIPYSTLEFNNSQGITLRTNATFALPTELWVTNSGTYLITFSAVLKGSAGGTVISLWLRKNGSDVARTRTDQGFTGATAQQCMTVNFFQSVTDPCYFELCAASHDATPPTIVAATANPTGYTAPAMPSIIVTINRVSDSWP